MYKIVEQCQQAPPDYFGYLLHLEENNLAQTGLGKHRDSDILTISNYETILTDLQERFPDDVEIDSANHWAVGWVDTILVTAWIDPLAPHTDSNVHPAFIAAKEWGDKLSDYPVADEDDYSRREYEDALETLEYAYNIPEDKANEVFSWLFDNYSRSSGEEYIQREVDEAKTALGLDDDD